MIGPFIAEDTICVGVFIVECSSDTYNALIPLQLNLVDTCLIGNHIISYFFVYVTKVWISKLHSYMQTILELQSWGYENFGFDNCIA